MCFCWNPILWVHRVILSFIISCSDIKSSRSECLKREKQIECMGLLPPVLNWARNSFPLSVICDGSSIWSTNMEWHEQNYTPNWVWILYQPPWPGLVLSPSLLQGKNSSCPLLCWGKDNHVVSSTFIHPDRKPLVYFVSVLSISKSHKCVCINQILRKEKCTQVRCRS